MQESECLFDRLDRESISYDKNVFYFLCSFLIFGRKWIISECSYEKLKAVAITEGVTLGSYEISTSEECREKCDQTERCNNFRFCAYDKKCKLYQGMLRGSEPEAESDGNCVTFYKKCKYKTDSIICIEHIWTYNER